MERGLTFKDISNINANSSNKHSLKQIKGNDCDVTKFNEKDMSNYQKEIIRSMQQQESNL